MIIKNRIYGTKEKSLNRYGTVISSFLKAHTVLVYTIVTKIGVIFTTLAKYFSGGVSAYIQGFLAQQLCLTH